MKNFTIKNPTLAPLFNNANEAQFIGIHSAFGGGKSLLGTAIAREALPQISGEGLKTIAYLEDEIGLSHLIMRIATNKVDASNLVHSSPSSMHKRNEESLIEHVKRLITLPASDIKLLVIDCPEITENIFQGYKCFTMSKFYRFMQDNVLAKDIDVVMTFHLNSRFRSTFVPRNEVRGTEEFIYDNAEKLIFRNRAAEQFIPICIGFLNEPEQGKYDCMVVSPEEKHFFVKEELVDYVKPPQPDFALTKLAWEEDNA